MTVRILQGDCRDVLRAFDGDSIDACVTDPPYGLSFMGKAWDYEVPSAHVWREVFRVLKPGAHLLAFFGARTYHRGVVQIEDAGFEIRDQIMWIYGSGFPKSHNIGDGWGTALKPAHEPIVVARKPLIGTVAQNVQRYGTGAINIDASRIEGGEGGNRDGEASADRRYADKGSTNFAPTPGPRGGDVRGRWPANVMHDGSDEVLAAFPDAPGALRAVGPQYGVKKSVNAYGDYGPRTDTHPRNDSGSAARFFYCAKASKQDRDEGLESMPEKPVVTFQTENGTSGKASSISEGRDTRYRNTHPTVKPTDLMRYLCRLVTPPGGVILDPFMGSGSTGKAAVREGFDFVGIEQDPQWIPIARARIEGDAPLFAEVGT